jgi:hypothetical protein
MKFLIKAIILSVLFSCITLNPSSILGAAESEAGASECRDGDDPTCNGNIKYDPDAACLTIENSCPVEFLESILCTDRPYLCPGKSPLGNFTWGKLVVIHADVLYKFGLPSQAEIDQYTDHEDEVSNFINHEALEFVICTFDEEKQPDKKICVDGSIYLLKNCSNPRLCTGGHKEKNPSVGLLVE